MIFSVTLGISLKYVLRQYVEIFLNAVFFMK